MKNTKLALLIALPLAGLIVLTNTSIRSVEAQQPARTVNPPKAPPSKPQPAPVAPAQQPATRPGVTPAQPVPGQPVPAQIDPSQPVVPVDPINPTIIDPADPSLTPEQRDTLIKLRASRPFNFQSPQSEAIFNDGVQRLMRDEQRFTQTTDEHLRRLGEVRGMTGERQTAALLDLVQQLLISNKEFQQYIVRSRSLWTGDMTPPQQTAGVMVAPTATTPGR